MIYIPTVALKPISIICTRPNSLCSTLSPYWQCSILYFDLTEYSNILQLRTSFGCNWQRNTFNIDSDRRGKKCSEVNSEKKSVQTIYRIFVLVANVTLGIGKCIVSNTDFLFSLRNLTNQCSLVYQVIFHKEWWQCYILWPFFWLFLHARMKFQHCVLKMQQNLWKN